MKKQLFIIVSVAIAFVAQSAYAKIETKISGRFAGGLSYSKDKDHEDFIPKNADGTDAPKKAGDGLEKINRNAYQMMRYGRIYFKASGQVTPRVSAGVLLSMEMDGSMEIMSAGKLDITKLFDESYIWITTALGRLELGGTEHAPLKLSAELSSMPNMYYYGLYDGATAPNFSFAQNLGLTGDENDKINYFTGALLKGIEAGISFTKDPRVMRRGQLLFEKQYGKGLRNIFEFAVRYKTKLENGMSLTVSTGYSTAGLDFAESTSATSNQWYDPVTGDAFGPGAYATSKSSTRTGLGILAKQFEGKTLQEIAKEERKPVVWTVSTNVKMEHLSLSFLFLRRNERNLDKITEWIANMEYKADKFTFGFEYAQSVFVPFSTFGGHTPGVKYKTTGLHGKIAYSVGDGVSVIGGYAIVDNKDGAYTLGSDLADYVKTITGAAAAVEKNPSGKLRSKKYTYLYTGLVVKW